MAKLKYPFQPNILDSMPMEMQQMYRELENTLLEQICVRIRASGQLNEVTVEAIRALRSHGTDLPEIEDAIRKTTGLSQQSLNRLFQDVEARNQSFYTKLINMAGLTQPQTLVSTATLDAITRQAQNGLRNLTRSMGFLVNNGQTLLPPAQAYQWALDQALLQVESGAIDYNTAYYNAIRQLADSGLRAVSYESGHISALDVAVRRAVMTGVNQINQKYRDQSAAYLGTETFEVTAHLGARNTEGPHGWENHSKWQGKVYSAAELQTKCGQGSVTGLGGANCRHSYWPFLPGISERTYTDKELEEMKPENRPKITFEGKQYDDYQASQMQRRIEASYRKHKRREIAFKAAGDDLSAAAARIRCRRLNQKYTEFSRAAGLPEQRERMRVYTPGSSRSSSSGSGGGSSGGSSGAGTSVTNQLHIGSGSGTIPMRVAANGALRNTGARPQYNPNADFSIKLNGYSEAVLSGLSRASAQVAREGGKDLCEHLCLVDLETGDLIYHENGTSSEVGGEAFWQYISEHPNGKFAFVHNHITDGFFSEGDMTTLLKTFEIPMFIAVRLDGVKYVAERTKMAPRGMLEFLYEDEIKKLREKVHRSEVEQSKYATYRELIIVENSLREYTKGLIELDGRRPYEGS